MQLRIGRMSQRRYCKLRSLDYSIEMAIYEADQYTIRVLQRYKALVSTRIVKSEENLKMKKVEELQRLARSVHDDFVAECIDKIEEAAKAGEFSVQVRGGDDELIAIHFYCESQDLVFNITGSGITQSVAVISWATPLK